MANSAAACQRACEIENEFLCRFLTSYQSYVYLGDQHHHPQHDHHPHPHPHDQVLLVPRPPHWLPVQLQTLPHGPLDPAWWWYISITSMTMSISNIIFFLKLTNMNITITITTISTIITNMTTMTNIIIFLKLTNMNNPLSTTWPPNPIPPPIVRGKCFNLDPKEKKTAKLPPGGGSLKNAMHSGNLNAPTIALKKKKKFHF